MGGWAGLGRRWAELGRRWAELRRAGAADFDKSKGAAPPSHPAEHGVYKELWLWGRRL